MTNRISAALTRRAQGVRLQLATWIFALATSGLAQSDAPETPRSVPGAETHVFRQLVPEPVRLHVFKPPGWSATDQRPAFLFFFGGGWTSGTPDRAAGWAKMAARWGMVGVVADYRTKQRFGTSPLESVADSRLALRWMQDHAAELGIDPRRIVVGGNSSGGHVAIWTGISKAPPGSSAEESPRFKPVALVLNSAVTDTSKLTGYTPQRFGENATALSPVHQLDEMMPPTIAFHGAADELVPHAQAAALHQKLLASGNISELHSVPGGSHQLQNTPGWTEKCHGILREFLRKQKIIE